MRLVRLPCLLMLAMLATGAPHARAAASKAAPATPADAADKAVAAKAKSDAAEEPPMVTRHELRLDGKVLKYTVTTGLMPLKNEEGEVEYVDRSDLRVEIGKFRKELLRARRRSVGRLDSRFLGIDPSATDAAPDFDPSLAADGYPDTSEALRDALARNPDMRVYVASGYFDLATPYFATQYTLAHMGLDPSARARIRTGAYAAGHMMSIHAGELARLEGEVAAFVKDALAPR